MPSVLFVCSANQLRSPLAEVLFRNHLQRRKLAAAWQVGSAGVWALEGSPAARAALRMAAARGLDLSAHTARPVTEDLLRGADLVLVMEQEHLDALRETFPGLSERVHLLTSMASETGDVEDPMDLPLERVQRLVEDLDRLLEAGWPRIRALTQSNGTIRG
ncbi:MAG: hypothetical protein MUO35_13950 [Anaerolineales bacterium]|nr:hypothetical protein [Anaerolineales bacterium]